MDSFDSSLEISLTSSINTLDNTKISTDATQENEKSLLANSTVDRIICLYLRHNLSLVCLEDVMDLMNENREKCDQFPTNKKQILQKFREGRDLIEIIFFVKCKKCGEIVKINSENVEKVKCCDEIVKKTETNFFVYMPLKKQISKSIEKNWSYIQSFDTTNKNDGSYSDAHDGEILRDVLKQYEDDDLNILSLCLNVDGANRFNSNTVSLWPIQFTQNYLPPEIRFLPNNIIVGGLMYTEGKFDFRKYLLPLVEELAELKEHNIELNIEGQEYAFKPVITHCIVDLPAKSKIQETKQYGGYDACTYCEIPGELVTIKNSNDNKKGKKSNKNNRKQNIKNSQKGKERKPLQGVRYVEGDHSYPLRDEKETLKKMLLASSSSDDVDGIKDVSCLVALEHFNIVDSIGVEYMHCALLGVQKGLTDFFCNSIYSDSKFYITPQKRRLLNKRILEIKPTADIVRKPRSLDKRSNFKASEHRFMLLYYFPICLAGCVSNEYVEHVRLLSAAVYILLQSTIPKDEVDKAETMLNKFVIQHQKLFGKKHMVMVIHLLKHLAQSVRKLGPLWCHSAFPFERNNGNLLDMVRGTSDVLLQISSKYCLSKSVIQKGLKSSTKSNISEKLLLGQSINIVEKSLHVFNLETLKELDLSNMNISAYKRIYFSKKTYTSKLYTRPKKSIDYFIGLQNNMIGMAKFYFEYNSKVFVVMEEFEIVDYIYHISKVQRTRRNIMAPVNDIEMKYIYMKVGINNYVASPPNPYEKE